MKRRKRLNNITSMSLKLKSNLDLKTQVQIIEMPQTYLGRPAARTHVPGSSLCNYQKQLKPNKALFEIV